MAALSAVVPRVNKFLFDRLNHTSVTSLMGGAARIYEGQAPLDTAFPCVVYAIIDTMDFVTANHTRTSTLLTYVVRATTDGDTDTPIISLLDAMDDRLESANGVSEGIHVAGIRRLRPFNEPRREADRPQRTSGGLYEIAVFTA